MNILAILCIAVIARASQIEEKYLSKLIQELHDYGCVGTSLSTGILNFEDVSSYVIINPAMDDRIESEFELVDIPDTPQTTAILPVSVKLENKLQIAINLTFGKEQIIKILKSNPTKYTIEYLYYLIRACMAYGAKKPLIHDILKLISEEQSKFNLYLMMMRFLFMLGGCGSNNIYMEIGNIVNMGKYEEVHTHISNLVLDLRSANFHEYLVNLKLGDSSFQLGIINEDAIAHFMDKELIFVINWILFRYILKRLVIFKIIFDPSRGRGFGFITQNFAFEIQEDMPVRLMYMCVMAFLKDKKNSDKMYLLPSIYILINDKNRKCSKEDIEDIIEATPKEMVEIINALKSMREDELNEYLKRNPFYLDNPLLFRFVCYVYYKRFSFVNPINPKNIFFSLIYQASMDILAGITTTTDPSSVDNENTAVLCVKTLKFVKPGQQCDLPPNLYLKINIYDMYLVDHLLGYSYFNFPVLSTIIHTAPHKDHLEKYLVSISMNNRTTDEYLLYLLNNNKTNEFERLALKGIQMSSDVMEHPNATKYKLNGVIRPDQIVLRPKHMLPLYSRIKKPS